MCYCSSCPSGHLEITQLGKSGRWIDCVLQILPLVENKAVYLSINFSPSLVEGSAQNEVIPWPFQPALQARLLSRPLLLQKKSLDKTLEMLPTVNQHECKQCTDLKDVYEASRVSAIYLARFLFTSIPEIIKRWRHLLFLAYYVTWFFMSIAGVTHTKMQPQ